MLPQRRNKRSSRCCQFAAIVDDHHVISGDSKATGPGQAFFSFGESLAASLGDALGPDDFRGLDQ